MPAINVCCFANVMRKEVRYHPLNTIYDPCRGKVRPLFVHRWSGYLDIYIRSKVTKVQNFQFGSDDLSHAHSAVNLRSLRCMALSTGKVILYLCTKFEAGSSICSKVVRVPKFRKCITWPRPRPLMGQFVLLTQVGFNLYLRTNRLIRSKVIRRYRNFENASRDPWHAHLSSLLWSVRRKGPSSIAVTKLNG